jgi:ElaB/YqjD/DUF883 family membrane-anchored ribosome-binding protein
MKTKKATSAPPTVPDPAGSGDPEAIRADIAQTRAELGDSVEALVDKADVKARAKRGVKKAKARATQTVEAAKDRTKETAEVAIERAKETAEQVGQTVRRRPAPVAAALAGIAAAIGAVVFIKRRRAAKARTGVRRWMTR